MKMPEANIAKITFKNFCQLYNKRDLDALLQLFTKNSNLWGTAIDEYRVGLNQIENQLKRDWSQADKGELEIIKFVNAPQDSLWVAAICRAKITIAGHEHILDDLRGTIVVEKEEGTWKISHMHVSFPDFRNEPNKSFPV